MSKAEQTRQYIIEKAAPVFNKKGYAGTSLSDIMEATGLTKGSIYGNFENKDDVATAVFEYNVDSLNKKISDSLKDKTTATAKLKAFTNYYRENWKKVSERGGCPLQNASIEADDNLMFLRKTVQNSVHAWVKGISTIIEQGKTSGEFKKSIDSKLNAYTIITLLEGGIMLFKIMNTQTLLFNALDRIDKIVEEELKK